MSSSSDVVKAVDVAPMAELFSDDEFIGRNEEEQSDVECDGRQSHNEDEEDQFDIKNEEEDSVIEYEKKTEEPVDWSALEMLAEVCVEVGKYEGLWE